MCALSKTDGDILIPAKKRIFIKVRMPKGHPNVFSVLGIDGVIPASMDFNPSLINFISTQPIIN